MHALLLLSLLGQSPTVALPKPASLVMRTWSDGERTHELYESVLFIAEPSPSDAQKQALLAREPGATVAIDRPTMRVWKVRDPASLRAHLSWVRPVFHDLSSGAGRLRVPVGLVCDGVPQPAPWLEVLERSGARCLPDFWYPPVLR
jgi:hypothetical protein